ncbi:MAG: zinc-binding dehydrogenase [Armatimonadota bacterium]
MGKAMVLEAPHQLRLSDFPEKPLNEGEILLRVRMTGVCGTDKHLFLGHGSWSFPIIAGHELVGEIVEVAEGAADAITVFGGELREGQRVVLVPSSAPCGRCFYCLNYPHRTTLCRNRFVYGFRRCDEPPHLFGGFAEFLRVQPRSFLFVLPDDVPDERAVLTEPTAVALRAVERALSPGIPVIGEGLGIGRRALVIGVGPIGLLVVAVLKTMGVHFIIAADISAVRLEWAQKLGASKTVLVHPDEPSEAIRQILALTDGEGADVVFECAGTPSAFLMAIECACRGATVIEVGHFTESGSILLSPHLICRKDLDVRGVWAYPWWQFRDALRFLQTTKLPVETLITHRLTLNELPEALKEQLSGDVIKPVIVPDVR